MILPAVRANAQNSSCDNFDVVWQDTDPIRSGTMIKYTNVAITPNSYIKFSCGTTSYVAMRDGKTMIYAKKTESGDYEMVKNGEAHEINSNTALTNALSTLLDDALKPKKK